MSNLVEIAKDLEYVPDEQLIQLANGSDPRFPPFVVISEIKRRTDMRSRSLQPMPKTTVAQEMVQEFAMPSRQGLEGMSQDATGILPPTVYNRDMPSSMMADGGLVGYADKGQTETTGSKIKRFLTAPIRAISDLGRLQYEASEDAKNRLKEKISTNADRRNDLITKSLPVIKGEKTLQEFREEMEELFNSDFIKDDKNYRNQIRNYYFRFEKEFLPRFQKEIEETGQMPKDVISHYNKYENFRNSNRYLNPFDTGYERPDLSLPEQMQKKQEGGLVGYASGDEIKYRNAIEELAGAKLGPSNPKSLSESILERYKKSQQRGRFINDPNNPLNKIFRYIPDAQQVSNFLQGKRGEDFTPDKPKNKKQEGGLIGYQTGNQTALGNTFLYTPTIEGNIPFSEQGLYRLLEERGITSEGGRQEISDILSSGLDRFSLPRRLQIADVLRRSNDFLGEPKVDSPIGRMFDRRSFADEILEGVSPGPEVPEGFTPPKDNKNNNNPIVFGDTPPSDDKPSGLASAKPQLELPEPPKPPTAAERQQELNANVLMTLGSAIGSSTTPQEIFKNLSGLPQQLMAIKSRQRQEDKDYKADLRANIKDQANYDIALKKLDVSITAARNSKNSDLVKYLGELKDLFTEASSESERTKLMEEINAVSSSIFSALVGKSPNSDNTDALNAALKIGTKS